MDFCPPYILSKINIRYTLDGCPSDGAHPLFSKTSSMSQTSFRILPPVLSAVAFIFKVRISDRFPESFLSPRLYLVGRP